MQPKETMPILPYPAFLVGRYAAQANEILREADIAKNPQLIEDTPGLTATDKQVMEAKLLETTRISETALLSNIQEDPDEMLSTAVTNPLTTSLELEDTESLTLDLYT